MKDISELQELIQIDFCEAIPDLVAEERANTGGDKQIVENKYKKFIEEGEYWEMLSMLGFDSYEEYADDLGLSDEFRELNKKIMNDAHAMCSERVL